MLIHMSVLNTLLSMSVYGQQSAVQLLAPKHKAVRSLCLPVR